MFQNSFLSSFLFVQLPHSQKSFGSLVEPSSFVYFHLCMPFIRFTAEHPSKMDEFNVHLYSTMTLSPTRNYASIVPALTPYGRRRHASHVFELAPQFLAVTPQFDDRVQLFGLVPPTNDAASIK